MATVMYLDARRDRPVEDNRGRLPVTRMLNDLSRESGELANDWLFQMVSPEAKRRMLAERGIAVADAA